jgi:hypothetical protein
MYCQNFVNLNLCLLYVYPQWLLKYKHLLLLFAEQTFKIVAFAKAAIWWQNFGGDFCSDQRFSYRSVLLLRDSKSWACY